MVGPGDLLLQPWNTALVSLHIGGADDRLTINILKWRFLLYELTSRHFLISKRETGWLDGFFCCLSLEILVLSYVWISFFKSDQIVYFVLFCFFNQCVAEKKSSHFSEGLCLLPHRQTFFLCNPLICMAMTFVVPVISSDNGRACRADLKTYSLIMCC